jgi:hypothetical protein
MPEYSIGDVVRHVVTGDEGRIVRMVEGSDIRPKPVLHRRKELAYIVAIPAGHLNPAREVLWFEHEVEADGHKPEGHGL